jgi:predicted HTH transcriptional regulator
MPSLSHIKKLIAQGEHQTLDFKFGITDNRKIARSMVAFSNTDGGILLIGVKDNGAIAGVRTEEEYYMIEAAAKMYCRPEINFEAKTYKEEGKTVLEVVIPKDDKEIHYSRNDDDRWLAWLRVNDQNIMANNVWIRVWKRSKTKRGTFIEYTLKEKLLLNHLLENEHITLSGFCQLAGIARKLAENILVNLISLDVVKMQFTEKGVFYKLNPINYPEPQ